MKLFSVFLVVTSVVLSAQERPKPVDTSPKAVLSAATGYLKAYQTALEFVLADEITVQEVFDERDRRTARRETSGDFFLSYVAADGGWLSVRDISKVDGKEVEAGDDLRGLLNRGSMARIGRALADRNARYNIGSVTRTFNDPMLALVILDPKHQSRFRFERRDVVTTETGTLVTLAFTERDRPTLILGSDMSPVYTRGELTIDAATGRLQRSFITMKDGPTTASLTTTFSKVEKLDLWLPSVLVERYAHATSRQKEQVLVESKYTNFRKFGVTVRIRQP
ncbi:MAG: hypothetical protein IT185_00235 [Acidobacteria bacterium]|nr:hypothetical protein [Acidobacteriota bacterium]